MRRDMMNRTYRVSFVTPAFLGGADQSAQWRVPPFKALLRRWWRVVWWNDNPGQTVAKLREEESKWFGSSADKGTSASLVRLRLDAWENGKLKKNRYENFSFDEKWHEEANRNVRVDLYLGYGPVVWNGAERRPALDRTALDTQNSHELRLMYPEALDDQIQRAMRLMAALGTLGGRSRNGWGSLMVDTLDENGHARSLIDDALFDPGNKESRNWIREVSLPIDKALEQDWCHALGRDEIGLLLWRTKTTENEFQKVFAALAEYKIAFRTQFHFKGGGPHEELCDRQILAYPVTNHSLRVWGNSARSANQIFFKVHPVKGGFVGIVAHLPHSLPKPLKDKLRPRSLPKSREKEVWEKVHSVLDEKLDRLP